MDLEMTMSGFEVPTWRAIACAAAVYLFSSGLTSAQQAPSAPDHSGHGGTPAADHTQHGAPAGDRSERQRSVPAAAPKPAARKTTSVHAGHGAVPSHAGHGGRTPSHAG